MPFGSERSHFAHSPHLLAVLIPLIPPEIGGELKRKARSRGCRPGFCCARSPGAVPRRASSRSRFGAGVDGNVHRETKADGAVFTFFRGCGQFLEENAGPSPPRPGVESPGQAAASVGRTRARGAGGRLWDEAAGPAARWAHRQGGGSDLAALWSAAAPGSRTTSHPQPRRRVPR